MAQGKDIINLGIGQPDFRTPEFIVEAAIKALRDGHHGYTAANGIPPLREAVAADLHRRHGVDVSPDSVMIMPGGKPTMFMSILMFGEPGADILYPDPGFPIYRSMIEYTGAKPVPIVLREANEFAFSADEVLANITKKTSLIILNTPSNPTGAVLSRAEIDAMNAELSPLNSFVLPGGSLGSAWLHLARTVSRRAERKITQLAVRKRVNPEAIAYINRLSDHLFVLARRLNGNGSSDVLWVPGGTRQSR